jgi:hypothetical protein
MLAQKKKLINIKLYKLYEPVELALDLDSETFNSLFYYKNKNKSIKMSFRS